MISIPDPPPPPGVAPCPGDVVWCPACGFEDGIDVPDNWVRVSCSICGEYVSLNEVMLARRMSRDQYDAMIHEQRASGMLEAL